MQKFYLIVFSLVFFLCVGNASEAQSQDTNNSVIVIADNINSFGGGQFNYSNQNTSVFGTLGDGNFGPGDCICYAGNTLSLRSGFSGSLSIRGGYPGLVNGNLYNRVFFEGSFALDGGNYVLPLRYSRSRFNVTFPATLTGFLSGYAENPFSQPTPPIFTSQLSLQGTVTVSLQVARLIVTPGGVTKPYYKINKIRYDFPSTSQNVQENNEKLDLLK